MKITLLATVATLLLLSSSEAHRHHKLRHKEHHSGKAFRFLNRRADPPAPPADPPADAAKPADPPAAEGDKKGDDKNATKPSGPPMIQDEMLPPNSFDVTQCNQVVTATGSFILDLWNTTLRGPMTFVMNVYTVTIFTKETPDSLLNSIDMAFVSDIEEIEGAPECIVLTSKVENKTLIPCFATEDNKPEAISAYEIFKKCMDGAEEELTPCELEAKMLKKAKAEEPAKDDKKDGDKPADPAAADAAAAEPEKPAARRL